MAEDGALYGRGYRKALLKVAGGVYHVDFVAHGILGVAHLLQAVLVFVYQAVGGIHDGLGGAVVLLQADHLRLGVVLLEVENVLYAGAAEAVDALAVVAHHADVAVGEGELLENQVLRVVGVLILVHKDVAEAAADGLQRLRMVAEKDVGVEQYVIEVHCSGGLGLGGVEGVDLGDAGALAAGVLILVNLVAGVGGRRQQVVLGLGDARCHGGGLVALVVYAQLLEAFGDGGLGVGRVVDGE